MPTELSVAPFRIHQQFPIAIEHPVSFNRLFEGDSQRQQQPQPISQCPSQAYAQTQHAYTASQSAPSVMSMGQQYAGGGGWADGVQAQSQAQAHGHMQHAQHAQHAHHAQHSQPGGMHPMHPMGGSMPMQMPHSLPGMHPGGMQMGLGGPVFPSTGPARMLELLPNKCLPNGMRNPYAPYAGETYMPISEKADRMTENHIAASLGAGGGGGSGAFGGSMSSPIPIPVPRGSSVVMGAPSAGWAESPLSNNARHMAGRMSISHSPSHQHQLHAASVSYAPSHSHGRARSTSIAGSSGGLAQARDTEGWDGRSHNGHHPDATSVAGRIGRSPGTGGLVPVGLHPGSALAAGGHARSLSATHHDLRGADYLMPNPSPSASSRPRRVSVGFAPAPTPLTASGRGADDCAGCAGGADLRRSASNRSAHSSHSHSHPHARRTHRAGSVSSDSGSPSPRSRPIHLAPPALGSSPLRNADGDLHAHAGQRRRSCHGSASGSDSGRRTHRGHEGRSACAGCDR